MDPWEWEDLEGFFNSYILEVADAGPLLSPIQSFTIARDDDRQLVLKTVVPGNVSNDRSQHPPGTVRTIDDIVTLRSHDEDGLKFEAVARGVISRECCRSLDRNGGVQTTETATLASISGSFKPDAPAAYTVEWLENVNRDGRIWTGATIEDTVETTHKRRLQAEESTVELVSYRRMPPSVSRRALELEIDGVKLFLCGIGPFKGKDRDHPGYILYVGHVNEDKRDKIHDVLSFCLGYYLVYLGYVTLDYDFEMNAVKAC